MGIKFLNRRTPQMSNLSIKLNHRISAHTWLVLAAMCITVLAYWAGLHGPFLLDDRYNLSIIEQWLGGHASIRSVLDGGAGMFGRPVSMASFAFNAWIGGYTPFSFKLGNLLTHLVCGLVIYRLVRRLASLDSVLSRNPAMVAAIVSTLWLLHPLQASTVLYAVQRMAQLSALFLLLGMWFYTVMRARLEKDSSRGTVLLFFAGMAVLLVTGFLAKENAILLPGLCLVIELAYYPRAPRPKPVHWLFGVFLWIPLLLGSLVLLFKPYALLGGYDQRDYDLLQRVLSQGRVLIDYVRLIIFPNPPGMGVYTDDFLPSTGLLSPPSTLGAIITLILISVAAWRLRQRVPAVLAGWGIFLAGHALESSFFPLELYFEHRNYLPLLGILYALAGLGVVAGLRLESQGLRTSRIGVVLVGGLCLTYAIGTHGRALVWSTSETLAVGAVESHPLSIRANLMLVTTALSHGDGALAEQSLKTLATSSQPRARASSHLIRLYFSCLVKKDANPSDLSEGIALLPPVVTSSDLEFFSLLFTITAPGCGAVTDLDLADSLVEILDGMTLRSDDARQRWHLRYLAGQFYLRGGDKIKALAQAKLAWQPDADVAVSALLMNAQLSNGDFNAAEVTLAQADSRIRQSEPEEVAWINIFREKIEQARSSSP